ncbi:MAG: UDP-glucose dehydrogenase family protein [bacterium]
MNICVIGTGYVGLVTGAMFADLGNDVVCVDKDEQKIALLNNRQMPIFEPGLEEMVIRNMEEERISFISDLGQAVKASTVVFIAVGTPQGGNGETDLSFVKSAAREIALNLNGYKVIVNKSTVPVGTGNLVRDIIKKYRTSDYDFYVVSNPEFLREGCAIEDTISPDRVVIGAPNKKVAMVLLELYAALERPMIITDVASAEMIKYASNSFLATKISFTNMIANLCEKVGADISSVMKGMGADRRIGKQFLNAGLGYGGSCFPKDVESLIHTAGANSTDFSLLEEVVKINKKRSGLFVSRIKDRLLDLKGKTVGILGLAFKPDTDDMREAKSSEIIEFLQEEGARIKAFDPVAMEVSRRIHPDIEYCRNAYEVATGTDVLIIVTEWREFKQLDLERIKNSMNTPLIFDGRNIYDPQKCQKLGFEYHSIGRRSVV